MLSRLVAQFIEEVFVGLEAGEPERIIVTSRTSIVASHAFGENEDMSLNFKAGFGPGKIVGTWMCISRHRANQANE